MEEVKSDITEFNLRVSDLMNQSLVQQMKTIMSFDKTFEAYQKASDQASAQL
jgi:hypothetical protein